MKLKIVIAIAALYTIGFIFFLNAKTLFDAAWLIAIFTIPASSAAAIVSSTLAEWFADGRPNVLIDLTMLFIFGLAQYVLLAYVSGWLIDALRRTAPPRDSNFTQL